MHRKCHRTCTVGLIGSGGLSSSRFDGDVPEFEVDCTWTASFSCRVKEAALWFESYGSKNLTREGPHALHTSISTDWLTRTHHWSSPRSKLAYKKPTSTRKLRKFPVTSGQGSKHHDWTASRWWARWRSQSSSCQHCVITWHELIPADPEYLDSVAWLLHDWEVAPVWHHDVTNARTCQFFRRLFDRLPVRISTSDLHHRILRKKIFHIRAYDFGVQFSFKLRNCFPDCLTWPTILNGQKIHWLFLSGIDLCRVSTQDLWRYVFHTTSWSWEQILTVNRSDRNYQNFELDQSDFILQTALYFLWFCLVFIHYSASSKIVFRTKERHSSAWSKSFLAFSQLEKRLDILAWKRY